MGIYIVHAFLKSIDEALDDLRIFLYIAFLGAISSVRHIAGFHAAGSHHISGPFLFQGCGRRFKFHTELSLPSCESRGCRAKVNAPVNIQILIRINPLLLQNIFKDHLRHAAFPSSQNVFPHKIRPLKVRHFFSGNNKVACSLGKLGKVDHRIVGSLLIRIDRGF